MFCVKNNASYTGCGYKKMAVLIRAGFRWKRSLRLLSNDIVYPQYRPRTGENEITKRKRLLYQSRLEHASDKLLQMLV